MFGKLVAEGMTPQEAKDEIGMAVEGAYTCLSARQLSKKAQIEMPITEVVYRIIYENLNPRDAVNALIHRSPKEEETF